jgi:hypothetical protein
MGMKMKHVKSTKGTHVYANDNDNAALSTVYIKRQALPNPPPKEIDVNIVAGGVSIGMVIENV